MQIRVWKLMLTPDNQQFQMLGLLIIIKLTEGKLQYILLNVMICGVNSRLKRADNPKIKLNGLKSHPVFIY